MNTTAVTSVRPRRALRSLGAVLAGLVANFALASATDLALIAAGVFPPYEQAASYTNAMLLLALTYRTAYGVLSCYIAARLAPDRPMTHAFALGFIGFALSVVGAVVMWNVGANWYSLAIIAVTLPCAWAGARLHERTQGA